MDIQTGGKLLRLMLFLTMLSGTVPFSVLKASESAMEGETTSEIDGEFAVCVTVQRRRSCSESRQLLGAGPVPSGPAISFAAHNRAVRNLTLLQGHRLANGLNAPLLT
ncbi:MAG: hypothetical protein KDA80_03340 [Planctomycetaceae bacterium]|nr:hypothetical protein [Planctomycetaceae bacterium]